MAIRKSSNTGIPFGNTSGRPSSAGTGQPYFNGEIGRLEIYNGSSWVNIVPRSPTVIGISGTYNETGGGTITITGTNYESGMTASAIGSNTVPVSATTVTIVSSTEASIVFPGLTQTYEPYTISVQNSDGSTGNSVSGFYINGNPTWNTSAGSLGTITASNRTYTALSTQTLSATDPESGSITYSVVSGALPTGLSLNASTGAITGTAQASASQVTHNFTVRAQDSAGNYTNRAFSITVTALEYTIQTLTSSQTWTVPANVTTVEAVAIGGGGGSSYGYGGGGGGGGAAYKSFTTSGGSTFSVTIGAAGTNAYPNQGIDGTDGGNTSFGSITGYGGAGARHYGFGSGVGRTGGCGGGGSIDGTGGSASQGTGGTAHYGFSGGDGGNVVPKSVNTSGCGAGGGLGSAGVKGRGGDGKQFFSQATYYGFGGNGHGYNTNAGFGTGGVSPAPANSGGGAGSDNSNATSAGSGVVLVRYAV